MAFALFFFFLTRIFAVTRGRLDECQESRCSGEGPVVRFPFRLNHQPDRCGYPGFRISCSPDRETILELPYSLNLRVTKINYTSQEILVSEQDHCKNFSLSAYPFRFMGNIGEKEFVFSCPESKADLSNYYLRPVLCGFHPGNPVYAVRSLSDLSDMDLSSCTMIYKFSLPSSFLTYDGGYSKYTVSMNWSRPACGDCEARGKRCRLKESKSKEPDDTECADRPPKGMKSRPGIIHIMRCKA